MIAARRVACRPLGARPPLLFVNPRGDLEFVAWAHHLVGSGVATPEKLQARLRERYPLAGVRRRLLSGELISVWYVYRDGHWVPDDGPRSGG
ncbi:MAG TPA: hypothetical protein VNJ28_06200 [Candidatus Limnocylindrales bacterium]|nr:hypothetical protein [Candidatus Limnocylindrales bacterium]